MFLTMKMIVVMGTVRSREDEGADGCELPDDADGDGETGDGHDGGTSHCDRHGDCEGHSMGDAEDGSIDEGDGDGETILTNLVVLILLVIVVRVVRVVRVERVVRVVRVARVVRVVGVVMAAVVTMLIAGGEDEAGSDGENHC